jgi:hypothetical protein
MLMRALTNLSIGIAAGEVFPSSRVKYASLQILINRGKVARVSSPPIAAIDALASVRDRLAAAGITTLEELIETAEVAGMTGCELGDAQDIAAGLLVIEKPCGCGRR